MRLPCAAPDDRYTRTAPVRGSQGATTYTSVLLAILVGILHAGLAPVLVVDNIKPDIVLVAVVIVTCTFGFTQGIVWAFVAGTVANLMSPAEPLGSIPLALLAAAVLVAAGSTLLGRLVWVFPVAAAFAASMVADLVKLAALTFVGGSLGVGFPIDIIVPAAIFNAAIAGLVLVPTRLLALRYRQEERAAW